MNTEIGLRDTCPGRNFVTVKVVIELAVKADLEEHVVRCLIGRDPRNIEDIR